MPGREDGVEFERQQLPPDIEIPKTAISPGDSFKDHELHGTIDEIRFSNFARHTGGLTRTPSSDKRKAMLLVRCMQHDLDNLPQTSDSTMSVRRLIIG